MQGGQQDLVKFARDREILRILQEETVANVPELIYRDLPVLLPAALELTAVRIWLEEKSAGSATPQAVWKVEMTGRTIQPNTPVVTPVNQFLERLKDAPWKMSIEATSLEDKAKVPIPDFARGAGKFYILAELR
jgi:hypothetical protein